MLQLNFFPFPTIITERLLLREITKKDAPTLFKHRSDTRVMQYLDRAPMQQPSEANKFIDTIKKNQMENSAILWAICLKEDRNKMIGNITFWRIDKVNHRAEIGYILHPDHWNKGIMNEAIQTVMVYGFNMLNLHSVEAQINPHNLASAMLLKKNGFIKEAHFKENFYFDGKFLDTVVYSKLAPEKE